VEEGFPGVTGFAPAAPAHNLRKLVLLRHLSLVGQVTTFAAIHQLFAISLPIRALASLTGFLALFNLATYCRLQFPWAVTDVEVFGQILVDVCSLGGLLYFSGGASNPFIGLFLVPLTISAVCLPRPYVLLAALATLTCCGLLAFFHASMPGLREGVPDVHLLVFGVWAICIASGSVIVYFVVTIATSLRKQRRASDRAREAEASGKYLTHIGALATSVVHEIRSPLTTMAVLVKELLTGSSENGQELARNLRIMSDQIEACRRALSELTRSGEAAMYSDRSADEFLDEVAAKWRVLRPDARFMFRRTGVQPPPSLTVDPGLSHAILNLLNNAAEAAPGEPVEMSCRWNAAALRIAIADRGRGFPKALKNTLGRVPCSTKRAGGIGIGLVLARASIEQCGGSLALLNGPHGARVEVVLPARRRASGHATPEAGREVEEQSNYGPCAG
jgi:two-component system, sensor histidine kinase RegB